MLCSRLWPRLLQGVGRPDEVLACVGAGVDLFEAFFPFLVTERGGALCFSFDICPDPERAGSAPGAGVGIGSAADSVFPNFIKPLLTFRRAR